MTQTAGEKGTLGQAARGPGARRRRSLAPLLLVGAAVLLVALGLVRGRERTAQRAAFPQVTGRLEVAGARSPLEIARDRRGVPHVLAASLEDAYFGLGFAHAQDRLAQMLWLRQLARGRSAEWSGPAGLEHDRLARTLGLAEAAAEEAQRLEARTRERLEAYARGVNARLARVEAGQVGAPRPLPPGALPVDPWSPADSLAVLKLYAWSLGESLEVSLVLDDLLGALGGVGARRFFPGGLPPAGEPSPGPAGTTAAAWRDPLRRALGLAGASAGSSAWVVGGAHSASGRPLLVADLHLEPTAPPLLHLAHVHGGGLDAAGVALPGLPGFWTGHNRRVAWASTNARAVVVDLYTERLHPGGEPRYFDGRSWRTLAQREEMLRVRDGRDEVLTVRSTHHGPLIHDLLPHPRDPLAVGWVGLRGHGADTARALLELAHAETAAGLRRALGRWGEPAVSVVYADAEGAAGLQVAGWIPERALATDLVPVPGRARYYDWKGRVAFEALPHRALDGGEGWVIAADNPLGGDGAGGPREWLWRHGVRARHIDAQLRRAVGEGPAELGPLAALQRDVQEPRAPELVARALRLADRGEPLGREALEVVELLRDWPGDSSRESPGAAAYHVFTSLLTEDLLRQWLGDDLMRRYLELAQVDPTQVVYEVVREAAAAGADASDPVADSVRRSLRETWFQLSYRLGASRARWRWGRLHQLRFRPFVPSARPAQPGLGPFEARGSGSTVHAAEYSVLAPYDVRLSSLCRFAADAGALDHSLWSLAPGQSEHPAHAHRLDGLEPWREGRLAVLATSRSLLEDGPLERLLLEPAP